jgi:hypothetical protein
MLPKMPKTLISKLHELVRGLGQESFRGTFVEGGRAGIGAGWGSERVGEAGLCSGMRGQWCSGCAAGQEGSRVVAII